MKSLFNEFPMIYTKISVESKKKMTFAEKNSFFVFHDASILWALLFRDLGQTAG